MTKLNQINHHGLLLACFLLTVTFCSCSEDKTKFTEAELERIAIAKKVELVHASGGLVLMVEGETLTSDELINASVEGFEEGISLKEFLKPMASNIDIENFKVQARPYVEDLLMGKISNILLYQHAKRETGDNEQVNEIIDGLVEKEWRKYVLRFGGDVAKADAELIKQGKDREKFKEEQKKIMITQSFIASKFPKDEPITYSQLKECYEQIKDRYFVVRARITFRLIDINVLKVIPEENSNPVDQAKKLAADLIKRIRDGEDFGKLAEQYSNGHRSSFGGLWEPVSPDSLVRPYDQVAKEIEKIEVGQVAGPIDTIGHIFIARLEDRQKEGYEPFEKVQRQVERYLITERQNSILRSIAEKYLDQASVGKTDEFMDFCMEKIFTESKQ